MKRYYKTFFALLALIAVLFTSCVTSKKTKQQCSRQIMAKGIKSQKSLENFLKSYNNQLPSKQVELMAQLYIQEAGLEGINSDVAFVQMCLETGFLTFGNLVVPEMHNYCGLGAMNKENPGEWFKDEQEGVRAHIQHLQAYATNENVKLNMPLVDPRYSWVHKAKFAGTIYELAGQWATDKEYGNKLNNLLSQLENY